MCGEMMLPLAWKRGGSHLPQATLPRQDRAQGRHCSQPQHWTSTLQCLCEHILQVTAVTCKSSLIGSEGCSSHYMQISRQTAALKRLVLHKFLVSERVAATHLGGKCPSLLGSLG